MPETFAAPLTNTDADKVISALLDSASRIEAEANDADAYGEPGSARASRQRARQIRELASKINDARLKKL